MKASLVAVDLYSGCGGLTAGLKKAGFEVLGAIEIDRLAAETYAMNHPEVRLWERDILTVSPRGLARALHLRRGELDLLAGCPPCQGFSTMRTLNGGRSVRDRRNGLVLQFVRFAEYLRPRAILMENVSGLAGDRRLRDLSDRLRNLGYTVDWRVVDAAGFGVPQRRRRLVLMGALNVNLRFPKPRKRQVTVRQSIGHLPVPGLTGDPLHDFPEQRTRTVEALIRRIPRDGGSREALGTTHQLACHTKINGFHDVYGRMAWDSVAPTITSGCVNPSKGRFLHPDQNRAITLREAALLQGFPRRYRFSLRRGKFAVAEMIGNALPPAFVAAHARALAAVVKRAETST